MDSTLHRVKEDQRQLRGDRQTQCVCVCVCVWDRVHSRSCAPMATGAQKCDVTDSSCSSKVSLRHTHTHTHTHWSDGKWQQHLIPVCFFEDHLPLRTPNRASQLTALWGNSGWIWNHTNKCYSHYFWHINIVQVVHYYLIFFRARQEDNT